MATSNEAAREAFLAWKESLNKTILSSNSSLMHTYSFYFQEDHAFLEKLQVFAEKYYQLEALVGENNQVHNLPRVEQYDFLGNRTNHVIHHSSYVKAGDLIYGTDLMRFLLVPGQMKKTLALFFLSSHAGEAGHNCPIACSAGVIRVLLKYSNLKDKPFFLKKLTQPSFQDNFTGAQFLTEIQGGNDVGANTTVARCLQDGEWSISGEKWFCSNANAELLLMTARFDESISGTKGLGLFLLPNRLPNHQPNHYQIKRLKEKIGTKSMATAEIEFKNALAYPIGDVTEGIHLVMENVLHVSRLFNAFSVLGMSRRAFQIAYHYAQHRKVFGKEIIEFPLIQERLALIKANNLALLSSSFRLVSLQDELDSQLAENYSKDKQLLLRTLVNLNKYFTARQTVRTIHHCIDILAGNGTIENFSPLPRLLRDSIVCENWEGTHFALWMQTLKDMQRYVVEEFISEYFHHLMSQLDSNFTSHHVLLDKLKDLEISFKNLKKLPFEEQTISCQPLFDEVNIFFAALSLSLEMTKGYVPSTKEAALTLFLNSHWHINLKKDEHYLIRLKAVLQEED